jgi:putative sugar O-methyltransferase
MTTEVKDDFELLDLLFRDEAAAPPIYRPAPYWDDYRKPFVEHLRRVGLTTFRSDKRTKKGNFSSFGATDLVPPVGEFKPINLLLARGAGRITGLGRALTSASYRLSRLLVAPTVDRVKVSRLQFEFVRRQGETAGAKPLEELCVSTAGAPEDLFQVDGNLYTTSMLYYYLRYVYLSRFLDLEDVSIMVELGPGSGKQAEILHKMYPKMTIYLFDIPPEIYITEQYLKAALGEEKVLGYRETRSLSGSENLDPGIVILPSWKFPMLQGKDVDLFWSMSTFQVMEPAQVKHFLGIVNETTSHVYLMQAMEGHQVARRRGQHGVSERITLDHYRQHLKDFELVHAETPLLPDSGRMEAMAYMEAYWTKKRAGGDPSFPDARENDPA